MGKRDMLPACLGVRRHSERALFPERLGKLEACSTQNLAGESGTRFQLVSVSVEPMREVLRWPHPILLVFSKSKNTVARRL